MISGILGPPGASKLLNKSNLSAPRRPKNDYTVCLAVVIRFLRSKPVVVEPQQAQVSSDAGLLPFRQLDERLGLTRQFAEALTIRRHAASDHSFLEMTRMRVYGILADYADQNDHDVLRSDPIFKLFATVRSKDEDLASQPTLSRFENAIDVRSFRRCRTCCSTSSSPRSTSRRGS